MDTTDKIITTVGIAVLAVSILSIGSCVQYDRKREMAYLAAGGTVTYLTGAKTCAKISIEPIAITIP